MAASKLKNCDSSVEAIFAAIKEDAAENIEYDYLGSALVKIKGNQQHHYNTSTILEILHKYSSGLPGTSPHVYRLAEELRRWALDQSSSRLVMFRGMSGSGKSESFRSMIQHFIYTDVMQSGIHGIAEERDPAKPLGFCANPMIVSPEASATVKKLYASICLLNAFGSAPTEKNPWSTRIGQYVQLHFSSQGRILDAVTIPVFTEMLRCNPKDPNVGPLYIQHLLVHARGKPEYLQLNSSFRDIYNHFKDSGYDAELYHLHDILVNWGGLHEEQWEGLLKVVASVVHLQNVNILGSETTMISANTKNHVTISEQLLGLEQGSLLTCIMKKVDDRPSRPAGSTMECRPHESKIIVDLLCNELIVRALTSCLDHLRTNHVPNMATFFDEKVTQDGSVSIFDPSGWERYMPQTPGNFYQYLNHYVEEKYNTFAIQEQFLGELYAYQDEGIQLDFIVHPNISQYVELLELSPGGLIGMLEDACGAQKPDDKVFADKAILNYGRAKLVRGGGAKTKPTTFVVRHSYSEVAYDCDGFIFANKLSEPSHVIMNALKNSNVPCLQTPIHYAPLLSPPPPPPAPEEGKGNRLTKAKITLLYTKFLQMTDKLFAHLSSCEKKNFVLCVNACQSVDDLMLTGQIQSLLLPNLVDLAKFGFGYRLQFAEFFHRYRILAKFEHATLPISLSPSIIHDTNRMRSYSQALMEEVTAIIARLGMTEMDLSQGSAGLAVYGKTSIFIKDAFSELMERARFTYFERYTAGAVRLQSFLRMRHWRREFTAVRKGVVALQSYVLGRSQRKKYLILLRAALKVKGWFLTRREAKKFQRMRVAVGLIKSKLMGKMVQRIRYQRLIRAARSFQHLARGCLLRRAALNVFDAVVLLQRTFRSLLTRRRRKRQRQESILRIQRIFRGHRARGKLGNLVHVLKIRREQRIANTVVQKLQSIWRGKLVIARFQEIVAATIVLQRWGKACIHYRRFQKIRALAVWLQSQARRLSASKRTNAIKVGNMVREEKGTLASLYLQEISIICHPRHTILTKGFTNHGRDRFERDLLMYDISFDLTIAYPDGWLPTILSFAQELRTKENRLIEHLVVGAQHTVLVDDFHQVYTFGLGDLGQLGHNSRKSHSTPKKIEQLQRFITQGDAMAKVNASTLSASKLSTQVVTKMGILSIACGQDHTLLLSQTKKMFSWGDNRRGQLGHSNFEVSAIPRLVTYTHSVNKQQTPLQNVSRIYCGKYHSACLAENGFAYVWGSGEVCMGIDRNIVLDSQTLNDVTEKDLFQIIDTYYKDVTCRYDPAGIAGSGPRQVIDFCEPRAVSVLNKRKIFAVVSGEMHMAVVANDGIYTWGCNTYGQLGLGHTRDVYTVSKMTFHIPVAAHAQPSSSANTPTASTFNNKLGVSAANKVVAAPKMVADHFKEFSERDLMMLELFSGGRHMFVRTKNGALYGWGWNKYGQVGDGSMENVLRPTRIIIKDMHSTTTGANTKANTTKNSSAANNSSEATFGNIGVFASKEHPPGLSPPSTAPAVSSNNNNSSTSNTGLAAISLALGWRSTMAIVKTGHVYGWGIMSSLAAAVDINASRAIHDVQYEDPSAVFWQPTCLPITCSANQVAALLNKHTSAEGLHTTAGFALSLFMLDRVLTRDGVNNNNNTANNEEDNDSVAQSQASSAASSLSASMSHTNNDKAAGSKKASLVGMPESKPVLDAKKVQRNTVKLDILRAAKTLQERQEREANARYDTKTGGQKNNTKTADEVLQRFRLEVGRMSLHAENSTTHKRNTIITDTTNANNTSSSSISNNHNATKLATSGSTKSNNNNNNNSSNKSPRVGGGGAAMRTMSGNSTNNRYHSTNDNGNHNVSPGRTFTRTSSGHSPGRFHLHDLQGHGEGLGNDEEGAGAGEEEEEEEDEDTKRQRILQLEQAKLEEPGALLDLFSPAHYSKIKQRRHDRGSFQPPPGTGIHVSTAAPLLANNNSSNHNYGVLSSSREDNYNNIAHSQSTGHMLLRTHSSPPRYTQSLASASQQYTGHTPTTTTTNNNMHTNSLASQSMMSSPPHHANNTPMNKSPLLYLNQRHPSPNNHHNHPNGHHHAMSASSQDYVPRIVAYEMPIVTSVPSKDMSATSPITQHYSHNHNNNNNNSNSYGNRNNHTSNARQAAPATTQRSDMMFLQSFLQKTATSTTARSLQRKHQQQQQQQQQQPPYNNSSSNNTGNHITAQKTLSIDPYAPPIPAATNTNATANNTSSNYNNGSYNQSNSSNLQSSPTMTRRLSALTTPLQQASSTSFTQNALQHLSHSNNSNAGNSSSSGYNNSNNNNNGLGGLLGVSGAGDPGEFRRQMQELGYLKRLEKK